VWIPSIRRIIVGVASYAMAAFLRLVPDKDAVLVYAAAGIVVFFLLVLDEYSSSVRPAKRIAEITPITLDGLAEPLLSQLKANGVVPRLNLMMPKRTWRWCGIFRYFKIVWSCGMENQPDVNLSFRVKHGIAGECFRTRKPIYSSPDDIRRPAFALPMRIARHAPDLAVIFAYPVYEPARKGRRQSGKVIGVLNLDSTSGNAYNVLMAREVFDAVHRIMQTIATIAGRLYE
jgi:hypothetical protein